ncbi:hypothetical protein B0H16DRAFT_1245716, partial [Mycena metata]
STLSESILSLPTEITVEIFRRCCAPDARSRPHPSEGPLLLAQICHQWRQIAIHAPEFWRDLNFTDRLSVDLFKLWLERSGNLPLKLELYGWDIARTGLCVVHSHRWQDVKFGLPFAFYTPNLGNISFPILRSISLDNFHLAGRGEGSVTMYNTPLLREAHILTLPDVKVNLLWSQLTSLTLRSTIDLAECITVLRGCPDLRKLTVFTSGQGPVHTDFVVLPTLESLQCNFTTVPILEHLTLPRLQRLCVTDTARPQHADVLKNFIRRSACPLHSLVIAGHNLGLEAFISCLTAL